MKRGPRLKICRRVGDRVFGKCEDPKFELSPKQPRGKHRRSRSEYGIQLTEKQKVRFTYGISERQFANYVKKASAKHGVSPAAVLYESLERRLDNVIFRMGVATSRAHARQMVSHGHVRVNGRRVNIPSYQVRPGETVSIKDRTKESPMIVAVAENLKTYSHPNWIVFDPQKLEAKIGSNPRLDATENTYNLTSVIEFYSR